MLSDSRGEGMHKLDWTQIPQSRTHQEDRPRSQSILSDHLATAQAPQYSILMLLSFKVRKFGSYFPINLLKAKCQVSFMSFRAWININFQMSATSYKGLNSNQQVRKRPPHISYHEIHFYLASQAIEQWRMTVTLMSTLNYQKTLPATFGYCVQKHGLQPLEKMMKQQDREHPNVLKCLI